MWKLGQFFSDVIFVQSCALHVNQKCSGRFRDSRSRSERPLFLPRVRGDGGLGKMLKPDVLGWMHQSGRTPTLKFNGQPVFPLFKGTGTILLEEGKQNFQRSYFLQVPLLLIFWVEWYGNRVTEETKVTQMSTSPGQHLITKLAYGIFASRMSACLTTTQTQPRS